MTSNSVLAPSRVAPRVIETAKALTEGCETHLEKAIRLHDFVRDKILFGFTPLFDSAKAQARWRILLDIAAGKTRHR